MPRIFTKSHTIETGAVDSDRYAEMDVRIEYRFAPATTSAKATVEILSVQEREDPLLEKPGQETWVQARSDLIELVEEKFGYSDLEERLLEHACEQLMLEQDAAEATQDLPCAN